MTLYKQYVYSQNGTLINRFNFKDLTTKFGVPISNSANGQNFIFKQSIQQLLKYYENDVDSLVKEYMTIHIMNISVFGTRKIKEINLLNQYKSSGKSTWLDQMNLKQLANQLQLNQIEIKAVINDNGDVCA